jgi:CHAT domain-containing protein
MASHAQFGNRPDDTFLLTNDGQLHMNELEKLIRPRRFRERAIDLITLSACETAAGDERTALGLAGVALKSGARSALATLWSVDDAATYKLITMFYEYYKDNLTKAQALQKSQKRIRAEFGKAGKDDPRYWAAFLIIGNWI